MIILKIARFNLIFLVFFTFTGCTDSARIVSSSMLPTYKPGDMVMWKPASFESVVCGDLIVMVSPLDLESKILRRVVAKGPCTVSGSVGVLDIDGENIPLESIGIKALFTEPLGEVFVPEGCIFVLGDNLKNSLDGRHHGFTRYEDVLGKVEQ